MNHRQSTKDHVQQGKQRSTKRYTDQATCTPLKTGVNYDELFAPMPTPVVRCTYSYIYCNININMEVRWHGKKKCAHFIDEESAKQIVSMTTPDERRSDL